MIIILSPSKTLDMESQTPKLATTKPALLKESETLIKEAQKLSKADIQALMKVSDKIATLNHERFQNFKTPFTEKNAHPAIYSFKGDVYEGLDIASFSDKDVSYAQDHLRVLSGLYGLLRPLDLMQAYRLEMGIKFANPRGKNLYEFWGERITNELNDALKETKSPCLINLASGEYFKAIQFDKLAKPVITPTFKESKNGTLKVIGLMAKKARGRMATWLIKNQISQIGEITTYDLDGYQYRPDLSSETEYVFAR